MYRSRPLRGALFGHVLYRTKQSIGLDMYKVCTEAVHCIALPSTSAGISVKRLPIWQKIHHVWLENKKKHDKMCDTTRPSALPTNYMHGKRCPFPQFPSILFSRLLTASLFQNKKHAELGKVRYWRNPTLSNLQENLWKCSATYSINKPKTYIYKRSV